jgi:hypothetical protein
VRQGGVREEEEEEEEEVVVVEVEVVTLGERAISDIRHPFKLQATSATEAHLTWLKCGSVSAKSKPPWNGLSAGNNTAFLF